VEQIDRFARERSIERNEAILELIEAGLEHFEQGGTIAAKQQRSFEELNELRRDMEMVKDILSELRNEVRLVHHTIETDFAREARCVPYQSRYPWEFWRK